MSKLVIVIGDYSAGTIESAAKNQEDILALRSGDSADARVLSEIVAQDPDVNRVITLPVSRQFSPSSAGALTKEALKFGFNILEHPGTVKGFEDVTEVSIVGNVAPGIKSLSGSAVGQTGKESNADREAFIDGTVSRNGKTINVGATNAFLDGQGHALGAATELEKEGYTFSEFKAVGGEEAQRLLKENGQFRSRALLAYTNRVAGKPHEHLGEDLLPLARAQHALLSDELKQADEAYAKDFLKLQSFVPVIPGDARKGFVTVISSSDQLDQTLRFYSRGDAYSDNLVSGLSFDGNETARDRKVIATLNKSEKENYHLTRQAFLAANLANEFHRDFGAGTRTIILDSKESPLDLNAKQGSKNARYDVELQNGSHIITANSKLLAFTTDTIARVSKDGAPLQGTELEAFMTEARNFRSSLKDSVIENDPYRNVKLARTFGENLQEVNRAMKESGIDSVPDNKALALTLSVRTGNIQEERTAY